MLCNKKIILLVCEINKWIQKCCFRYCYLMPYHYGNLKENTKNKRIIIFILYKNYNLYAYFFLSQTSPTFVQPLLSNVIKQQGVKHS